MTEAHPNPLAGLKVPAEEEYLFCIRCGLCLPACPTYRETLNETQSPRGRVALVRHLVEGNLPPNPNFSKQVYDCLDCLACNAICPVGIKPADLCLEARHLMHHALPQPWIKEPLFEGLFGHPERLERLAGPLRLYHRLGGRSLLRHSGLWRVLPTRLRDMERLLPPLPRRPLRQVLPEVTPARSERRYRVGFFLGCVQSLVFAEGSAATVRVLAGNGCEVITPCDVACCGMPPLGYGLRPAAEDMARRNITAFEQYTDLEAIVTDCATCGATLKEYATLLADDPEYAGRAGRFSRKVQDISEFLAHIELAEPKGRVEKRVTYHDPCHLVRGQGLKQPPRQLLARVPGLELVEMRDADVCCGAAGTYLLTHHQTSVRILERKMANVAASGAEVVASGCPGCQLQLRLGAQRAGLKTQVVHPIQLLDEAYRDGGS